MREKPSELHVRIIELFEVGGTDVRAYECRHPDLWLPHIYWEDNKRIVLTSIEIKGVLFFVAYPFVSYEVVVHSMYV